MLMLMSKMMVMEWMICLCWSTMPRNAKVYCPDRRIVPPECHIAKSRSLLIPIDHIPPRHESPNFPCSCCHKLYYTDRVDCNNFHRHRDREVEWARGVRVPIAYCYCGRHVQIDGRGHWGRGLVCQRGFRAACWPMKRVTC